MTLSEIEAQVKAGKLSLAEAIELTGCSKTASTPIVVKRNKSGGFYIKHPGLGDSFGMNLTERQGNFILSQRFVDDIVPLMLELPAGCAPAK